MADLVTWVLEMPRSIALSLLEGQVEWADLWMILVTAKELSTVKTPSAVMPGDGYSPEVRASAGGSRWAVLVE